MTNMDVAQPRTGPQTVWTYRLECSRCGGSWSETDTVRRTTRSLVNHPGCPNGRDWRKETRVRVEFEAHYRPDIRCTARCWSAAGRSCSCECGGSRHGSAVTQN